MRVGREQIAKLREQLKDLRESGEARLSTSDPEARFLRERGRFVLGYTATPPVVTESISLVPLLSGLETSVRLKSGS
jgi:hypothetical protein